MQEANKEILGFSVKINIASTLSELAELAGSEARAVELANNYVLFHQAFGTFRTLIVEKLEELTGIKRLTEGEGDEAEVIEKDAAYVDRLKTEHSVSLADYAEQIQAVISASPVNYKATRSGTAAPKKLAAKYITAAQELITAGKAELFATKYNLDIAGVEGDALVTLLANKVREVVIAKQREAEQNAMTV